MFLYTLIVIINTMQEKMWIREWKRKMREREIEVVDIPPRIRKHNYTETKKKRLEEKEK